MISIVLITLDRLHLLEQCVEKVMFRTTKTTQIIIWDNGSIDGTKEFLSSLKDPRLKIIFNGENIGLNAYARACKFVNQDYIIELDDDIIDAPAGWDEILLDAYQKLPKMGFLASNIIDDGKSIASDIFYRSQKHLFTPIPPQNGVRLISGPVGGYCAITSSKIYKEVGGFAEHKELFFQEDGEYCEAVKRHGYETAILADLKVFHASGPAYSEPERALAAKNIFYGRREKIRARKNKIKKLLEAIPGVVWLNRRFNIWQPPI